MDNQDEDFTGNRISEGGLTNKKTYSWARVSHLAHAS